MKFRFIKDIKEHWFVLLISGAWAILVIYAIPINYDSMKFIDLIRLLFVILLISIPGHFYYVQELFRKQNIQKSPIYWYLESLLSGLVLAFLGAIPVAIIIVIIRLIFNI